MWLFQKLASPLKSSIEKATLVVVVFYITEKGNDLVEIFFCSFFPVFFLENYSLVPFPSRRPAINLSVVAAG